MNLHDWIDELCDVLDLEVEVDEALVADLVEAARTNVEPAAGPVTAYLLGVAAGPAARPDQVEALAARAQTLAQGWDRPAGAPDPDDVDDDVPDDAGVDHAGEELDD
ncbi:DUF6457 domain-containing protein [Nocardioides nanhaiensis]|uniref:DUF6457 domain-containing protein n=1 Tax=Nocardioides nanhaiensis TaxID=1476871 RepID=A0ABP8WFG9_9ACTN